MEKFSVNVTKSSVVQECRSNCGRHYEAGAEYKIERGVEND